MAAVLNVIFGLNDVRTKVDDLYEAAAHLRARGLNAPGARLVPADVPHRFVAQPCGTPVWLYWTRDGGTDPAPLRDSELGMIQLRLDVLNGAPPVYGTEALLDRAAELGRAARAGAVTTEGAAPAEGVRFLDM